MKTPTAKTEDTQAKQNYKLVQAVVGLGTLAWTAVFAELAHNAIGKGREIETGIAVVWGVMITAGGVGVMAWLRSEKKKDAAKLLRDDPILNKTEEVAAPLVLSEIS